MFKALASGTIVDVVDGKATFPACNWLVRVFKAEDPTGEWFPESFADTFDDVECGARLLVLDGVALDNGHTCEMGHEHLSYQFYAQSGREAEAAFMERQRGDDFDPSQSLSHVS